MHPFIKSKLIGYRYWISYSTGTGTNLNFLKNSKKLPVPVPLIKQSKIKITTVIPALSWVCGPWSLNSYFILFLLFVYIFYFGITFLSLDRRLSTEAEEAESEIDLWRLFFTDHILGLILRHTNERIAETIQELERRGKEPKTYAYVKSIDKARYYSFYR